MSLEQESHRAASFGRSAQVARALSAAKHIGKMTRDRQAADLWRSVYEDLSEERGGFAGSITARAEAHVLRLSMIYALLDGSTEISLAHLSAALELWAYSERSEDHIFSDALGDPVADTILRALRNVEELSRTEIFSLLGRHENRAQIERGLASLQTRDLAEMRLEETAGRSREIWRAVG